MAVSVAAEEESHTPSHHHFKSFFSAAGCTSATGISLTPPPADATNLLCVTRPFTEDSTDLFSTVIERSADAQAHNDTLGGPSADATVPHTRSNLRKSPSWSSLFTPGKSPRKRADKIKSLMVKSHSDPVSLAQHVDKEPSPYKARMRAESLKDQAINLFKPHSTSECLVIPRNGSEFGLTGGETLPRLCHDGSILGFRKDNHATAFSRG